MASGISIRTVSGIALSSARPIPGSTSFAEAGVEPPNAIRGCELHGNEAKTLQPPLPDADVMIVRQGADKETARRRHDQNG